ncbi:hypothetical protein [Rugosimonospora acidiphila]|uniref:hypothetical protein n=1 Tax=Rugosimonospora acidiphila TaxID=556531 RepID=UPI0031EA1D6F
MSATPTGALVLTGQLTQTGHPVAAAIANSADPAGAARLVHLVEEDPLAGHGQRYLGGQPNGNALVVVSWLDQAYPDEVGLADHVARVQARADFYGLPVQIPPVPAGLPDGLLRQSPRLVPVDVRGEQAPWEAAQAVWVLPRARAAMREALHEALDLAADADGPEPSGQRLAQYLERVAEIRQSHGLSGPTGDDEFDFAFGAYVARYGLPAGADADALRRSVLPMTPRQLAAATGATDGFRQVDAGALLAALRAAPGSVVLVSHQLNTMARPRVSMLVSGGLGAGLRWVEPRGGSAAVRVNPAGDDWRMVALRDRATRVLVFDPSGALAAEVPVPPPPAPAVPADRQAGSEPTEPQAPSGPRPASGGSFLGKNLRRVVYRPPRADGFVKGGRARKRGALPPGDQNRVARLRRRLAELLAPRPDAGPGIGPADLVADLAGMGVLSDQGSPKAIAAQGDALIRRLPATSGPAVDLVWARLFDSRADTSSEKVVQALELATNSFIDVTPDLLGAEVTADGENLTLHLLTESGTVRTADREGFVAMAIRLIDDPNGEIGASRTSPVEVRRQNDQLELVVRRDASDAALRVGVAGALAQWLATQPAPGAGAAAPAPATPDDNEAAARRHIAELTALKQLGNARSRFGRARRAVFPAKFHKQVIDRAARDVLARARTLLASQQLSEGTARALADALHGRVPTSTASPLSTDPGFDLALARRMLSAIPSVASTVVSGQLAGRSAGLTASAAGSSGVGGLAQAGADAVAQRLFSGAKPSGPRQESEPGLVSRAPLRQPARAGLVGNLVKQAPAGLSRALVSLVALGATGSPTAGAEGLLLTFGSGGGMGLLDYLMFHETAVGAKRFKHELERTVDHVRNDAVERLYHLVRELIRRQEQRNVAGQGGDRPVLTAREQRSLREARLLVADMMRGIQQEVTSLLEERQGLLRRPLSEFAWLRSRRTAGSGSVESPQGLPVAPGASRYGPSQTYDQMVRGVRRESTNPLVDATWWGGLATAGQVPQLILGMLEQSAVGLLDVNVVSAAIASVIYGVGWGALRPVEAFLAQVAMSWDTRQRLSYVGDGLRYLLQAYGDEQPARFDRGERIDVTEDGASASVPGTAATRPPGREKLAPPVPIDETVKLKQRRYMRRLGAATAYGRALREAGRPAEVSNRLQLLYKHLLSTMVYAPTSALLGTLVFPLAGPVLAATVVGGVVGRITMAAGENLVRTRVPTYQLFKLKNTIEEQRRRPINRSKMVAQIEELAQVAAEAHEQIQPVERVPRSTRRFLRWTVAPYAQRRLRQGYGLMRWADRRVADALRRQEPPVLSRGPAPAGNLRLAPRDVSNAWKLRELAREWDRVGAPGYSARADLDPQRIGEQAVVLLDRLGLRAEQDPDARRWNAAAAYLRRGRLGHDIDRSGLRELRGLRPGSPAGQIAPDGVGADGLVAAINAARAEDRLATQLWAAIDTGHAGPAQFHVRGGGLVKVFPQGGHRFLLSVSAGTAQTDNTRAVLRPAHDDLLHITTGTYRDEPLALSINPRELEQPARLAETLDWAVRQAVADQARSQRVKALLEQPEPEDVLLWRTDPQGQPIPGGVHLPSSAQGTPADLIRAQAIGALPTFEGWRVLSADYDPVTRRANRTVTDLDQQGRSVTSQQTMTEQEFIDWYASLPGSADHPVILLLSNGARYRDHHGSLARRLGQRIGQDVVASADDVLLDEDNRLRAVRVRPRTGGSVDPATARPGMWWHLPADRGRQAPLGSELATGMAAVLHVASHLDDVPATHPAVAWAAPDAPPETPPPGPGFFLDDAQRVRIGTPAGVPVGWYAIGGASAHLALRWLWLGGPARPVPLNELAGDDLRSPGLDAAQWPSGPDEQVNLLRAMLARRTRRPVTVHPHDALPPTLAEGSRLMFAGVGGQVAAALVRSGGALLAYRPASPDRAAIEVSRDGFVAGNGPGRYLVLDPVPGLATDPDSVVLPSWSDDGPAAGHADLDHTLAPAVMAKRVKEHEQPAGGIDVKGALVAGTEVSLNPAWMPLSDFAREVWEKRPAARWLFAVTDNGEPFIGVLKADEALLPEERDALRGAIDPDLDEYLGYEMGHVTVGARFDEAALEPDLAFVGRVRIAGELLRRDGAWVINDRSGRYMHFKLRPNTTRDQAVGWLRAVAQQVADQTDEPVRLEFVRNAEPRIIEVSTYLRGRSALDASRPDGSGPQTVVRYRLAAQPKLWTALFKVHLVAGDGVGETELDQVRRDALSGVRTFLNAPRYKVVTGADGTKASLNIQLDFVDAADEAHAVIDVGAGQASGRMTQRRWLPGAAPEAYAQAVALYLGMPRLPLGELASVQLAGFLDVATPFVAADPPPSAPAAAVDTGAVAPEVVTPRVPTPEAAPFPAPRGARLLDGVMLVGSQSAWEPSSKTQATIVAAAQASRRPVIAVKVQPDATVEELEPLDELLLRYSRFGTRPVVVTLAESREALRVMQRYEPVLIRGRTSNFDEWWELPEPDGTMRRAGRGRIDELLAAADPVVPDVHRLALPPTLAGLLAQNSWPERERYLRAHADDLLQPDVTDALRVLRDRYARQRAEFVEEHLDEILDGAASQGRAEFTDEHRAETVDGAAGEKSQRLREKAKRINRELRLHDVRAGLVGATHAILRLVEAAGGVAPASEPRFVLPEAAATAHTAAPQAGTPRPMPRTPLRETFAFDFLASPRPTRARWYETLLRVTAEGILTAAQMADLAGGVVDAGPDDHGLTHAKVFRAIHLVMRMTEPELTAQGSGDLVRREVSGCRLTPQEKLAWVNQIDDFIAATTGVRPPGFTGSPQDSKKTVDAVGGARAELLNLITETLATC